MTDETPKRTIQHRRGTAAQWAAKNPTLAQGEPAFETDTGKQKIGDGTTPWATLPYLLDSVVSGGGSARFFSGPTADVAPRIAALPSGTEYVWNKTDGAGVLLDLVSGVAA